MASDYIKLPAVAAAGGDSVVESTFSTSFPGSGSVTFNIRKIGKLVIMEVPEISGTADGGAFGSADALDAALCPRTFIYAPCWINENGTDKLVVAEVDASGSIKFINTNAANLAAGACFVNSFTMTWTLA